MEVTTLAATSGEDEFDCPFCGGQWKAAESLPRPQMAEPSLEDASGSPVRTCSTSPPVGLSFGGDAGEF